MLWHTGLFIDSPNIYWSIVHFSLLERIPPYCLQCFICCVKGEMARSLMGHKIAEVRSVMSVIACVPYLAVFTRLRTTCSQLPPSQCLVFRRCSLTCRMCERVKDGKQRQKHTCSQFTPVALLTVSLFSISASVCRCFESGSVSDSVMSDSLRPHGL